MGTWSPTDTANGWWPILSWPWVMFGTQECRIHNLQTGETRNLTLSPGRSYAAGWWTAGVECAFSHCPDPAGNGPQTLYRYNTTTAVRTTVGTLPLGMNMVRASKGHWAYTVAGVGLWYDGVKIDTGTGWPLAMDGTYLAQSCNDGIRIWNGATKLFTIPLAVANTRMALRYPYLGYGYGQPRLVDLRTRVDTSVALSGQSESFPTSVIAADGKLWIWTPAQIGPGSFVVGRVFGSSVLTKLPRVNATFVDAELVGTTWVLASSSDVGTLVVEIVAAGTSGEAGGGSSGETGGTGGGATTTPGGANYPPFQQPVTDPATGLMSRAWTAWCLSVTQTASTNVYGNLAAGVVLGRGSAAAGPAVALTVGDGLTVEGNTLSVVLDGAIQDVIQYGVRSAQPAATTVPIGTLYGVSDEHVIERSNGTIWQTFA